MSKIVIDAQNLTKEYNVGPVKVLALKGLNLKIMEGELVAIVGPSGCGKSTLMNILGLLDRPTYGQFIIDEKDSKTANDNTLSRLRNQKIGFIFQSYNLLNRMSVLDNVAIPLIYRGMPRKEYTPICLEKLKLVGMENRVHHKPNELSGGQQQRVAIARALAGSPSILLADEPTGALDTETGHGIMELFIDLNRLHGITVLIITHAPDIAEKCKRQIHLKDGCIIKDFKT